MKIEDKLVTSVISGLKALYGQDVPAAQVQLQKTKKEFEGHLTLVVFPFLKMSKKGPEQTAQEIGEYLKANEPAVAAFNVIKGFLNLTVASATWIELLNEIHADAQYGIVSADENAPLVMIEYSSPNTNKPLHLATFVITCWVMRWPISSWRTAIRWLKPILSTIAVSISVSRCWHGKSMARVKLPNHQAKKAIIW